MAKQKKIYPQQILSPENYIRQKARNLPIHECKIHRNWESDKLTQVLISRKHANGNYTVCFYLVDLGCLGVKDSFFKFNIDFADYQELIEHFNVESTFITVPYELAHNIVFSALAYAEDLGFSPCKEFTQTTKYMLEEDTDDVELIEIECGRKGKPFYMNNGYENETKEKQILNQLEKSVGKGNFEYIMSLDSDEDDMMLEDEFDDFSLEELQDEFMDLYHNDLDNLTSEIAQRLESLTDEICIRICDDNIIESYLDDWEDETKLELEEEQINCKFLGLLAGTTISEKTEKLIDQVFDDMGEGTKKQLKNLSKLERKIGKTSFTSFLELLILRDFENGNYTEKLNEFSLQYPDYGLIRLLKHANLQNEHEDFDDMVLPRVSEIFSDSDKITEFEFNQFLSEKIILAGIKKDLNLIEAIYLSLDELPLSVMYYNTTRALVLMLRMMILSDDLKPERNNAINNTKLRIVK